MREKIRALRLFRWVWAGAALFGTGLALGQNASPVPLSVAYGNEGVSPSQRVLLRMGFSGEGNDGFDAQQDSQTAPTPGYFPGDVSNSNHNPVVLAAQNHPIFVNNAPSHWGDVGSFLTDLGKSDFVHVLDQYIGSTADNRYTLGTSFAAAYPIPVNHTLRLGDLGNIVHAAATVQGSSLGHVYHVFLPQGVDFCINNRFCYSPDNDASFDFCAFHTYYVFADIPNPVLVTLEAYQNVSGCGVPPGTPNGQVADSTNSTLSHEYFETISDPFGRSWGLARFTNFFGEEIGDLCTRFQIINNGFFVDYPNVKLSGRLYTVQPEYSNRQHKCVYSPFDDNE